MSLTRPLLRDTSAFDATGVHTFVFNVVGGSQVVKNRLLVRDNNTNAVVYDQSVTTFEFRHILPAGTLENGKYYNAVVQTFNNVNEPSPLSNQIQFYCFTSPTVTFTNIPVDHIIESSAFIFGAEYDQIEGELLNSYTFNLYSVQGAIVTTSGQMFVNSSAPPPTYLSNEFVGFDHGSSYFIECVGETVSGTVVSTGRVQFFVQYERPNVYAVVDLENNKCDGYISVRSNMVSVDGESNPSPPIYIDGTAVDVTGNGHWVRWTRGYSVSGDFTFRLWGRDFTANKVIAMLWSMGDDINNPSRIDIAWREEYLANDDTRYAYIDATVRSGTPASYYIYSNRMVYPDPDQDIAIWFRRINNIYEIKIAPYVRD